MTTTFRDQMSALRRQQIVRAATHVFAKYGFKRATIRQISQAAGVSDGTIYNVFTDKAALLMAALEPLADPKDAPPPVPDLSVSIEELLRGLLRARWASLTAETLDPMKIVLSEALIDADMRDVLVSHVIEPALRLPEPLFERLIAEGRLRPGDPATPPRVLVALVLGHVLLRLLGDAQTLAVWDALPDTLAELMTHGLAASGGGDPDVS